MPLAPLTYLLADARAHGYALGYFEAWDGYSLEAVVEAAEAERAPVIIGFGCLLGHQPWFDGGGIELLGALGMRGCPPGPRAGRASSSTRPTRWSSRCAASTRGSTP